MPTDQLTETTPHQPQACDHCGAAFTEQNLSVAVERRSLWEIPDIKPLVQGHVFYQTSYDCGYTTRLPVPQWIYASMGANLQAHLAYLTAEAKLSRRSLQTILDDVFHVPLALGTIQNRIENTCEILKPVCDELENQLSEQAVINIDETSYSHNNTIN